MPGSAAATLLASLLHAESPEPEPEPEPELVLEWHAPPSCPDAEAVRARLATYLGDDAIPSSHRASGTISADATGWSLRLVIDGELRVLHSPRCETLADAAAVVLSLAMDPELAPAPEETPTVVTPVVAAPTRATSPALQPIVGRARRSRIGLRVDGGVSGGIVTVGTDAAITFAVLWPRGRIELGGLLRPPGTRPRVGDQQLRIFYGSASARGCYVARIDRFELPLCSGLEIVALRVEPTPARERVAHHSVRAGIAAGAAFVWPFHRYWALWAGTQAILPFGRPRVALPSGTWRASAASLRVGIGIEARFP